MNKQYIFNLLQKRQKEIYEILKPHLPLLNELKEIDEQIKELGHISESSHIFPKAEKIDMTKIGYSISWTRAEKAIYVLKKNNKAMSMGQIVGYIAKNHEPEIIATAEMKAETASRYATTLKMKSENGTEIKRISSVKGGYLYGLVEWFNGEELKEQYNSA